MAPNAKLQASLHAVASTLSEVLTDHATEYPSRKKEHLRLQSGVMNLLRMLIELSKKKRNVFTELDAKELIKLITFSEKLKQEIVSLDSKQGLQELIDIDNETIEHLYLAAKELSKRGNFIESADGFTFLTLLNPKRYTFWVELANAEFYSQEFEQALVAYARAYTLNPSDPTGHISSARCYESLGQKNNAIKALDLALVTINSNQAYANWKEQVENEKRRLTFE